MLSCAYDRERDREKNKRKKIIVRERETKNDIRAPQMKNHGKTPKLSKRRTVRTVHRSN